MRDSNTNRCLLSDVLAELDCFVRNSADRNAFHCPLEHRKSNASVEVWLDAEFRFCVRCRDCGLSSELWQRIIGYADNPPGRLAGEVLTWATT